MTQFHSYAVKADNTAREAFTRYISAAEQLKKAERAEREYPHRSVTDSSYEAKRARAIADHAEAKQLVKHAQEALHDAAAQIAAARSDLATELDKVYSMDAEKIDTKALEMLKSGLMKSDEYFRMLAKAEAAENYTLMRFIGKYAAEAAEAEQKRSGDTAEAQALRAISYEAQNDPRSAILEKYDLIIEVSKRAADNPGMISHWTELVGQTVADF